GACGCGVNSAFSWQYEIAPGVYTAAGSQVLFDADNSSWCGAGCGVCYKLTNQGYSGCSTCGSTAGAGESIIVMVTNLCPHNGNEVWCPAVGATNNYGYGAHFDIMSTTLVNGTWDNPVVEYEQVTCPVAAMNDWAQCVCYDGIAPGTSSTSKPPSTSSTSSTHSSTSSSTKAYGQCGGIGWTGPTACAVGTCVYNNDWYSQCLPATGKRAARHHPKHIN
ncbi:hypothetical protein DL93DRAFT_2061731, partial [Clavulina sp. PMI_390]